ncbi:uncharacterized protein A1O9_01337 [Exophiala aquamarina CBS 119918]|uniref:Uncharacterized protein n=1 Tax=Exophiala aquamarina CBS 119918 TaxID=1182545 RepID=A0A072Q622_9EURO|nr:uncharacterized protein A1O9_01337 [Exophiala aquamarina CBS 119918]KEF63360.1 hypothetical protein A1O9_01337 [Exophiala aquamarina CBS 119918]
MASLSPPSTPNARADGVADHAYAISEKDFLQASTIERGDGPSKPVNEPVHVEGHDSSSPWLIVSPYLERQHQLDLRTVDTPYRLLALALTKLENATNGYAIAKYEDAFEWSALMNHLKDLADREDHRWTRQQFYVVEFRSKLKKDIDNDLLFKLDKKSHEEATTAGGLLKYWYGEPDSDRRNLATCLWRSKEDAIKGGRGPWHKQARACIANMYENIDVSGVQLTIGDNVESWHFERWTH